MAQLAMPYRIVLVAVLCIAAVWLTVLRPAPAEEAERTEAAAAPAAPAAPAAQPETKPRSKAAAAEGREEPAPPPDPAGPVLRALDDGRAAVLLFSDGSGVVDRAAREALGALDRRDGGVLVKRIPMRDVGRYGSITRGVPVATSPTLVVAGPARRAQALSGLVTRGELAQAVGDALDTTGDPLARARIGRGQALRRARRTCDNDACLAYFAGANDACVQEASSLPAIAQDAPSLQRLQGLRTAAEAFAKAVDGVAVPAAQAGVHRRASGVLRAEFQRMDRALAGAKQPASALARVRRSPAGPRADRQLRELGFGACA